MPEPTGVNNNGTAEPDPYAELIEAEEPAQEQTEVEEKKPAKEAKQKIQLDKEEPESGQTEFITEEDARRIGLSDTFIGKPYKETMEQVYKNAVKWDSKLSQQLADMQTKMCDFEVKLSKAEIKETEKEVEEKLPPISNFIDEDGFVNDRDGLNKYLEKRDELLKKELLKALEDKNAPIAQSVQETNVERYQANLYDEIENKLSALYQDEITPEIIQKVIDDYGDFMGQEDAETQKQYTQLYTGKPQKLARDIVNYHKAIRSNKPKTEIEQAALKAHKNTVDKLKKTEKTFVKSAASGRESEEEEVKKEDKDYVDLINEALDNHDAQERFAEAKG